MRRRVGVFDTYAMHERHATVAFINYTWALGASSGPSSYPSIVPSLINGGIEYHNMHPKFDTHYSHTPRPTSLIKMRFVTYPRTSRFHLPAHHRQLQDYRLRRILGIYKSQSSKPIPVVRAGVDSHLGLYSRHGFKAMYKYTDLASCGRALLKPLL